LAPDVANEPAEAGGQKAQLSTGGGGMFWVGVKPRPPGGAAWGGRQPFPPPPPPPPRPTGLRPSRRGQKLPLGLVGGGLRRHGGIDRDPRQILRPQRPALVRHPQALGQEKFQLAAEALAPMAQVRALVRKLVLEELLSGEVLEVWIIDPAFAHAFVGQSVNML